jgi:hypothetical protein
MQSLGTTGEILFGIEQVKGLVYEHFQIGGQKSVTVDLLSKKKKVIRFYVN